jgi:hypothetical protein
MLIEHDEYGIKNIQKDYVEKFILLGWRVVVEKINKNVVEEINVDNDLERKRGRPSGSKNKENK